MGFDWKKYQGDFVKFETPGTTVEGSIMSLGEATSSYGGGKVPELTLSTPEGVKTVTAFQAVLVVRLAEACPEVGDWVRITYDGEDVANKRLGMNPAKLFTVVVKRASEQATPDIAAAGTPENVDPF